jgi:Mrp family chromosome partitioning ATPase/capsular polysaccharide biosynthesis protein
VVSAFGSERQGTARYLQALAQHWPFIVGSLALAVAAAVLYLSGAESRYEAHADVLVTPVAINDATFVGLPVIRESGEGRGVLTAARLIETPQVADNARKQLRARTTREKLFDAIHVAPQQQSNIVTITAEAPSAEQAAAVANAFAAGVISERTRVFQRELSQVVRRLSSRLAGLPERSRDVGEGRALAERLGTLRGLVGARDPTLQIASRAVTPVESVWPRPLLSLAVATLVGLLLGIGIAIALELVNPLVLRDEDVHEERIALLARVPRMSIRDVHAHLARGSVPGGEIRNAFQVARVNLRATLENDAGAGTILVTSAAPGDDSTTAAVNLALAYAHGGRRVVLVDADFRRAPLARVFGLPTGGAGLRELLLEEVAAGEILTGVPGYGDRLSLVTARPDDGDAVDLFESPRLEVAVEELRSHGDVVIFDSPDVTEVAEALALATLVDAVVLVVRYGRTRREKLAHARLLLGQLGVVPAGVIAVLRRRARIPAQRSGDPAAGVGEHGPGNLRERPEARRRAGSSSRSG